MFQRYRLEKTIPVSESLYLSRSEVTVPYTQKTRVPSYQGTFFPPFEFRNAIARHAARFTEKRKQISHIFSTI